MSTHPTSIPTRMGLLCLALLLPACSVLSPRPTPPLQTYALEAVAHATTTTPRGKQRVILVSTPAAAPGYDSARMVFTRTPGVQEAFTQSVWVDTPARMLAPVMAHALQDSGIFRAVLMAPSAARADLRLDSSVVQLQQNYRQQPSQAHFTLRATLLDNNSREVLAWHEFDITQPASTEDASGAAAATGIAVQQAMQALTLWLADY